MKILVLDDDPTGSQAVHSCLLVLQWQVETLRAALDDPADLLFILTNTRALSPEQAKITTTEVCRNLKQALALAGITEFLVVSRSDSTLRGHYPLETDVIAAELGPFDAHFLVPAFFEGGRVTRQSTHYLYVQGIATPVHTTEFAQDSVFGYRHSYLPDYVEEKTQGRIRSTEVIQIHLPALRAGIQPQLLGLKDNPCVVVDAEIATDLQYFAQDILATVAQGKRFLFRSAASLLTALAALPPQPVAATEMKQYVRNNQPGVVLVGSHVQKTTEQIKHLLQVPGVKPVEIAVARLLQPDQYAVVLRETLTAVHRIHGQGLTPVVFTSREELAFADAPTRLRFGEEVSSLLMDVVRGLPQDIGFLISKGGITSNDVLSKGLALVTVRLLGQILPGCSLVRTAADHPQFPNLPVVLFPGNVGDPEGLATVYFRLQGDRATSIHKVL